MSNVERTTMNPVMPDASPNSRDVRFPCNPQRIMSLSKWLFDVRTVSTNVGETLSPKMSLLTDANLGWGE